MYKLVIVDDEALSRYAFRALITREFKDIEIIGEADSGRMAIDLNRKLKPDIIIMDIKMPGINGIEASQFILKESPCVKILILTAYDNFEFAKKAIDVGVKGYLLKPIQDVEVIEKVRKLIDNINNERNNINLNKQTENRINLVKPVVKKELLNAVISGNIDIDDVKSYLNFLHEELEAGYFMIISIDTSGPGTIYDYVKLKLTKDMIYNFLENNLIIKEKFLLGNAIGNNIIVFFPINGKWTTSCIIKESVGVGNEIKKRIYENTGINVAVGIGNPYEGIKSLKNSYDEANRSIKKAKESNKVLHYNEEYYENTVMTGKYPLELEKELFDQLKIGNIRKSKELLEDIIEYSFSNSVDLSLICEDMVQFVSVLKRTAFNMGVGSDKIKKTGTFEELKNIYEYEELRTWFKNISFSLIELVEALKKNKDVNILEQIHHYINTYFNKDISLDSIADKVGISPQYFSKIFKEGYGMNFIDYITEMRLNYSKLLLHTTDKSINDISIAVGYSDSNYFCRIFKKNIGITPGQYRINSNRTKNM